MQRHLRVLLVVLFTTVVSARGQLSISLRMDQDTFLLYESLPVTLSIRNFSARPVELIDGGKEGWLQFLVTDDNNNLIPAVGKMKVEGDLLVGPGQTVSRTVDLLPLYELRARGNYCVSAHIASGVINAATQTAKFTIIQGRELARITTGVPSRNEKGDEFRTYALLAHTARASERFYICVSDDKNQLVYGLIFLGLRIPMGEPELLTDRRGEAHVLFQNGPRSFGYVCVGPNGEVSERAVYTDTLTKPMLVIQEGVVLVRGGEKVEPKPSHMMTNEELAPPPPPVKAKKKWWWPFGSKPSVAKPSTPTQGP